jgi:hypothetical protein
VVPPRGHFGWRFLFPIRGVVNQGRTKLWRLEDVEMSEQLHPEVLDEGHKHQKVVGYYLTFGGRQKVGPSSELEV